VSSPRAPVLPTAVNSPSGITSPYKLCFGPKSFLVVSDPVQAKHMLRDANSNYDKGVLAEILEPIMVGSVAAVAFKASSIPE
jgi:hypothetical protein